MNNYFIVPTLDQLNNAYLDFIKQFVKTQKILLKDQNISQLLLYPSPTRAYNILQQIKTAYNKQQTLKSNTVPVIKKVYSTQQVKSTAAKTIKNSPIKNEFERQRIISIPSTNQSKNINNFSLNPINSQSKKQTIENAQDSKNAIKILSNIFKNNQLKIQKFQKSQTINVKNKQLSNNNYNFKY